MTEDEKIIETKNRVMEMADAFVKFMQKSIEIEEKRNKLLEKLVKKEEDSKASQIREDIAKEFFN